MQLFQFQIHWRFFLLQACSLFGILEDQLCCSHHRLEEYRETLISRVPFLVKIKNKNSCSMYHDLGQCNWNLVDLEA